MIRDDLNHERSPSLPSNSAERGKNSLGQRNYGKLADDLYSILMASWWTSPALTKNSTNPGTKNIVDVAVHEDFRLFGY